MTGKLTVEKRMGYALEWALEELRHRYVVEGRKPEDPIWEKWRESQRILEEHNVGK